MVSSFELIFIEGHIQIVWKKKHCILQGFFLSLQLGVIDSIFSCRDPSDLRVSVSTLGISSAW